MNAKGAVEAAAEWLSERFGPHAGEFGRLDMITAFNEGASWVQRQQAQE